MKKNILKSILITNFIIMSIIAIFGYISCSMGLNYTYNNADDPTISMYAETAKSFENNFSDKSGNDKYVEMGKTLHMIGLKLTQSSYEMLLYALVLSIVVGTAIGYIVSIVNVSDDKSVVIKKLVVTYLVGLLLASSFSMLTASIMNGDFIAPELAIGVNLIWTVIFAITIISKRIVDQKKAKKLETALNKRK